MRPALPIYVIVIIAVSISAYGQQTAQSEIKPVIVDVTVSDSRGRSVQGLKAENFKLFDENEPKEISSIRSGGEPVSFGIMVDVSGSFPFVNSDILAQTFRDFLLRGDSGNEYFGLTFAKSVSATPLSGDKKATFEALSKLIAVEHKNETRLLDALQAGINNLEGAKNRKRVLIILSDGMENGSVIKFGQAKRIVGEANIQLYLISTEGPKEKKGYPEPYFPRVFIEFESFVEENGGSILYVDTIGDLQDALARIDSDLRNQYTLEFMPSKPGVKETQKWRKLKVKIDTSTNKNLKNFVATPRRTGYYPTIR